MKDKTVLILTDKNPKSKNGLYETSSAIKEELDEMGIDNFVLFTKNAKLTKNENKSITASNPNGKEFTFYPENTSAVMRNSAINTKHGEDIVEDLEDYGVYIVNSLKSTKLVADKHKFSKLLHRENIKTPKTKLLPDEEALEEVISDFEFPAVFKTLKGSKGVGVFKIDKRSSAKGVLQALWDKGEDLLIQEYIKNEGDIRTIVIGGKIIGAMKRSSDGKDFRNNVSQGATVESYELNAAEKKEILKAAKASGCDICGVDHILTKNGPSILEVNSSPGTKGFKEVDEDIVTKMAEYVVSKHKKTLKETVLGYKENVNILDVGNFIAKLDTGNGRYSVIHGENIDIENETVKFEIDGNSFSFPLVEMGKVRTGAVSSTIENRPVIKLDISIGGKKLNNEPFFVTDRSEKNTDVLLSRALLNRGKIKVDPSKKQTIKESKYKGIKNYLFSEDVTTVTPLSDNALVRLSVIAVGSKLPIINNDDANKELIKNKFISNKGKITSDGLKYLKQPKMIVRLSKIGSR